MINKAKIQKEVIDGNLDIAIKMLLALAEKNDSDIYNSAIMLSSRINSLIKDRRNGIIAETDFNMNKNRITYALNQTIEDVDDSWAVEDTVSQKEAVVETATNHANKTTSDGAKGKRTILFLAANPKDTKQLRLDQEMREIDEGLRRSQQRDTFNLVQKWAVRVADLRRALLDESPNIIHFSGHGSPQGRIILEDEVGNGKEIPPKAIGNLFELFAEDINCVILNACYSESQAQEISKHISYVIGMNDAIPDKAAIEFSSAFYDAIGNGRDVEFAFKLARISIELFDIDALDIPVLIRKI